MRFVKLQLLYIQRESTMTIILLNSMRMSGGSQSLLSSYILPVRSMAVAVNIVNRIASTNRRLASKEISTGAGKFFLTYGLSSINSGFKFFT